MRDKVPIESRDYWFKVIEMLQQNWALIDRVEDGATVYFVSDTSGVFDQISFDSVGEAKASLSENGFRRFIDDPEASSFLYPPIPPFTLRPHPNGPIYSSGRFWKALPKEMIPTKKTKCHDLWCGLRRHPWQSLIHAFAAFSVLWTLTEGITHFLPCVKIEGGYVLAFIILASVCFGLNRLWKPSKIVIKVANTNTKIEVFFGDLFTQEGLRGIGVTEFFESKLGVPVSEKSLHGLFMQKCFGGEAKDFDKQLREGLKGISSEKIEKANGKKNKFPIGTTALINVGKNKYIVFAVAKTDPETCKANSDVTNMWAAMRCLWQRARIEAGEDPLNVPLIGSGLSGIGLPPRDLLNLIILSAITETKANRITEVIRIVLHPDRFEEINLRDVKKHWEE